MAVTPRKYQFESCEVWEWVLTDRDSVATPAFSSTRTRLIDINGTPDAHGFHGAQVMMLGDWVPDEAVVCRKPCLTLPDYQQVHARGGPLLSPVELAHPPFWCLPVVQGTPGPVGIRITMIGW